jgi:hypothetical protein
MQRASVQRRQQVSLVLEAELNTSAACGMYWKQETLNAHFQCKTSRPNSTQVFKSYLTENTLRRIYLTPCSKALLEKPPVAQLLKNFLIFYGTRTFITVFTRAFHWSVFSATLIQCILPHPTSLRFFLVLFCQLRPDLPCGILPSSFPKKVLYSLFFFPWLPDPLPIHSPWIDLSNYIQRKVKSHNLSLACRDQSDITIYRNTVIVVYFEYHEANTIYDKYVKKKPPWPKSASELYRPSDRRLSAKLVPAFADRRMSRSQRGVSPTAVISVFRPEPLLFFQVATQLYSRDWVDPVPGLLLLRKSGSTGNQTGNLWICSQELWPLDHRGSLEQW